MINFGILVVLAKTLVQDPLMLVPPAVFVALGFAYGRMQRQRRGPAEGAGCALHVDRAWARVALAFDLVCIPLVVFVLLPSSDLGQGPPLAGLWPGLGLGLVGMVGRVYAHERATRPRPPRRRRRVIVLAAAEA